MAQRLRELARAESLPQNERTELAPVIDDLRSRFPATLNRGQRQSRSHDRHVRREGADRAVASRRQRDAAQRQVTCRLEAVDEPTTSRLTVANDGDPISAPNRDRIFDAFFTTRRDSGGTGMGLAIVRAVMTSHGGSIRLMPTDEGVAFELQFPFA